MQSNVSDDRLAVLRDGAVAPAAVIVLLMSLEERGIHVRRASDEALDVSPTSALTDEDRRAIRRLKWPLLTFIRACERIDLDAPCVSV